MATDAGVRPGFITGANARIKLDGETMAYSTDLNFTVDVATIPIEVIGTYEVKSYEPIAYSVSGSFAVVRYTQNDKGKNKTAATGNPAAAIGGTNNVGKQINPGQILASSTFDIEIQQALDSGTGEVAGSTYKIQYCRVTRRSSSLSKRGVMMDSYSFVGVLAGDTDVNTADLVGGSGQDDLAT